MPDNLVAVQQQVNRAGRSDSTDRLAVEWVSRRWSEFVPLRESRESRWVICRNAFDGFYPKAYYAGRSNITPPDLYTLAKRLAPRIDNMTIGRGRFFTACPSSYDLARNAGDVEDLVLWQLEKERFRQRLGEEFDLETVIYGTGIAKKCWWKEVDKRTRARWVDAEPTVSEKGPQVSSVFKVETQEEVSYNGPRTDRLDIFRVWFNPFAPSLDQTDVVEKHPVTAHWLRRMADMGMFPKATVEKILEQGGKSAQGTPFFWDKSRASGHGTGRMPGENYTYTEFWGLYPLDAKLGFSPQLSDMDRAPMKQVRIGVVDDHWCVRLEENPYDCKKKPYFLNRISTMPGELYGMSLVERGLDIAIAIKDTLNQAMDAGTLANIPMMLMDGPKGQGQYSWGMGKILRGANLRPVQFSDNTMSAFRRVEILRRMLEDLFAAPPLLSGQELGGEGGATGAAIQDQQASMNLRAYASAKEENFLKPMLEFHHAMNEQLLPEDVKIVIQGAAGFEPRTIRRDDILGRYDFVMKGRSQQESRERMAGAFVNMAQTFLSIEAQSGKPIMNWPAFIEKSLVDVLHEDYPESLMAEGSKEGKTLSPIENLMLVASGRRVKIDMRQDFTVTLKQTTEAVNYILRAGRVEKDIEEAMMRYLVDLRAAANVWLAQKKMEMQAKMMEGGAPGAGIGSMGGASNAPIGPGDRDGKGGMASRQLMKQAVPGAL